MLRDWTLALQRTASAQTSPHTTLLSVVRAAATERGDDLALIAEDAQLSYRDLVRRAERYAIWALREMRNPGDVVCLLMPNCPDYVAIWLGIVHVRREVALINTNLVGAALAHSISIAAAKHVIVAASMLPLLLDVATSLPPDARIWVHGGKVSKEYPRIDEEVCLATTPTDEEMEIGDIAERQNRALLIYTSGTTGLPKAASVTHARMLEWSAWFAGMMDVQPEDRLYNCLPFYHSTGGVVAIGAMLTSGGSVVVRRRFSASRFWDDVAANGCTIFQYIGELCRYLVRLPEQPAERGHRLRLACGNGMRGDVWREFQRRFSLPRILEFYAATEGNVSLYNCEGKPGAIGRIPPFLRGSFPVELIRVDVHTGEPLRDSTGHCMRADVGEPGEAIGRIDRDSASPARTFDGYNDATATARKVLQSAFVEGDRWFRTGDLMQRDELGYLYFIDRLGDTFRWKGENVSTTEVASVLVSCPGVLDAVVYGVVIPGLEGRAGMAALATDGDFSLERFREYIITRLPEYARPLFVRVCDTLLLTGTFKLTKSGLVASGLSVSSEHGTLWFDDRNVERFVVCDEALLRRIQDDAVTL